MKTIEQIEHTKIKKRFELSDLAFECAYYEGKLYDLENWKWNEKNERFERILKTKWIMQDPSEFEVYYNSDIQKELMDAMVNEIRSGIERDAFYHVLPMVDQPQEEMQEDIPEIDIQVREWKV